MKLSAIQARIIEKMQQGESIKINNASRTGYHMSNTFHGMHMVPKSIIDFLSSAELIRIKGTEYILTEKGKSIKS